MPKQFNYHTNSKIQFPKVEIKNPNDNHDKSLILTSKNLSHWNNEFLHSGPNMNRAQNKRISLLHLVKSFTIKNPV